MTTSEEDKKLCSVIVSSVDMYEDLWKPFFTLFFRYWPDCPYPIYLMTNYREYNDPRVTTIKVQGGKVWGTNFKAALRTISTPYLIIFLEDFFLEKVIDTNYIRQLVNYMQRKNVACIHLSPMTEPDSIYSNNLGLGRISKKAEYRTSLRTALWDTKILNELVKEGESAWDMELQGTIRSRLLEAEFLSVVKPVICIYPQASVRAGKWLYDSIKVMKKEGIALDLKKRQVHYEGKWREMFDRARKTPFAQHAKKIPIFGKVLSWLFWRLAFLKIDKLINKLRGKPE